VLTCPIIADRWNSGAGGLEPNHDLAKPDWASAAIILFLGRVHLAYTFFSHKFSPAERQLETAMKQVPPRISREMTIWKAWIGFHVSHSIALMLFGLIYGYLVLRIARYA